MKPKQARKAVREAFATGNLESASKIMQHAAEAIQAGISSDSDAIVLVVPEGGVVAAGIIVGRSAIFSTEAREYLVSYHDGDKVAANRCIDWCANEVAESWKRGNPEMMVIPLRDPDSERWRSFRPPLTLDELKAKLSLGTH